MSVDNNINIKQLKNKSNNIFNIKNLKEILISNKKKGKKLIDQPNKDNIKYSSLNLLYNPKSKNRNYKYIEVNYDIENLKNKEKKLKKSSFLKRNKKSVSNSECPVQTIKDNKSNFKCLLYNRKKYIYNNNNLNISNISNKYSHNKQNESTNIIDNNTRINKQFNSNTNEKNKKNKLYDINNNYKSNNDNLSDFTKLKKQSIPKINDNRLNTDNNKHSFNYFNKSSIITNYKPVCKNNILFSQKFYKSRNCNNIESKVLNTKLLDYNTEKVFNDSYKNNMSNNYFNNNSIKKTKTKILDNDNILCFKINNVKKYKNNDGKKIRSLSVINNNMLYIILINKVNR